MAGDYPKSSALEDDEDDDPYYDPFDAFTDEYFLNVMASPNPNLMDLSFTENPPPLVPPTPSMEMNETQLLHELSLSITNCDTNDEFDGLLFADDDFTISWDMFESLNDDLNDNINVPGEIGNDNGNNNVGETTRLEVSTRVCGYNNGPTFETGGTSTMPVSVTPTISDGIFVCTCCNLLRGLVHTNGHEVNTLNIYGGIGFFCHAILETHWFADSTKRQHQTYHLKDLTMEDVKKFMEHYCLQREEGGLTLVQDTIGAFYQAMNVNSINNQSLTLTIPSSNDVPMSLAMPDRALDVPPVPLYVGLRDEPTTGLPKERERRKTPLAAQRERTGKLTLKDISMHFHLPIEEAAKKMNLCPTVLKKISRKGGLSRWPHRKIKSIENKISSLRSVLSTAKDVEVRANAEAEIERLQRDIDKIRSEALKNIK